MKIQSIFSCAGGLDYGFAMMPNLSINNATDINKPALNIYNANLNPVSLTFNDIFKIPKDHFKNAKILIGSKPCNNASKQNQSKSYNNFLRYIDIWLDIFQWINAEIGISENVTQFKSVFNGKAWDYFIEKAKSLGLKVFSKEVNFIDYGIPQNRKRLIYIVSKIKSFSEYDFFPTVSSKSHLKIKDVVKNADISWRKKVSQRAVDGFIRRSKTQFKLQINQFNKPAFAVVAHLKKESKWGLVEDPDNYDVILPEGCTDYIKRDIPVRCLSVDECAKIQGFPDNWIWPSKRLTKDNHYTGYNDAYWAIGHAVPPKFSLLWVKHLNSNIFNLNQNNQFNFNFSEN